MGCDGAESTCVEGSARGSTNENTNDSEQLTFIEMNFEVGIWSPENMCCCGVCGHEGDLLRI